MNDYSLEYCTEKIRILKLYLTKGEELLSNIEDWESLAGILDERDLLILELQHLDEHYGLKKNEVVCDTEKKNQIDGLINLIQKLDKNCIKLILEEKNKTMNDLKTNQHNQKVVNYEINVTPNYGTFLDAKK